MVKVSPLEGADKLKRGISTHGSDYQAGVNKVTENPAQKAIAAKDVWVAGIQDAIANNRYEKGLSRVTLADWKNSVNNGGVMRYTQSADKAATNYAKFAADFYPFLQNVQNTIQAMPRRNLQESIARMVANVQAIHEFKNR